tara:strand:+ start:5122 stop:5577 length:456 start_codon:yes stop_codon:yes gene_type:complete
MTKLVILTHYKGAPGLRLFGLGPNFVPCNGLIKLKAFLNENAFWAKNRDIRNLKTCLAQSDIVVSLWIGNEIVGFGRALTDGIYRGVLWDIVIDEKFQGKGYGKIIVKTLLNTKRMKSTKKIYLMTTNKKDFYCQLDFKENIIQNLLVREQ